MSDYNPNGDKNDQFGSDYINFNQFLMQHNLGNAAPFFNEPTMFAYSGYDANEVHPMSYFNSSTGYNTNISNNESSYPESSLQMPTDDNYFDGLARNSNLIATASEFVPKLMSPSTNAPLFMNAAEFIPKNDIADNVAEPENAMNQPPTFSIDSEQLSGYRASNWNDNYVNDTGNNNFKTEVQSKENRTMVNSKPDALSNAMNDAHISNRENSKSKPLSSAGGAIRKIKEQNYRNSSRDGNSDGNRNGNKQHAEHIGNSNRYNDRRREIRRNENNHYGTGRTASQYDNSDRYNNKNEYSSDKYKEKQLFSSPANSRKQNRCNSSGNQYHDSENGSRANSKFKERKHNETSSNKKFDESKQNRNGKAQNFKFNAIRADFGNCSQREKLIKEIDSGKLECLVCCEMIKPFQSIWSCSNCFHIIHLNCVIKWAASSKSDEGWRCCACQNITKNVPHQYYCFCGKILNPQYNRNDVAHSCGEPCGKKDNCVHPCTSLCHPGPCPPCQAMVTRSCGCGRTQKMFQCGQKDDLECDQICDKALNCSVHKCKRKCHSGACSDCVEEVEHVCHCDRDKKTLSCTEQNNESLKYSCGRVCKKQLKCKNHKCAEVCHPGDCGECKLLPEFITTCPCGKMSVSSDERKSCKDPIPLCTGNCKKPLSCGQPAHPHKCISKCHLGSCPPCNKQTSVKCRCGHMDQMIKCSQLSTRADDARCKKRCTKKRSCGKHKCNQECCIDIDHECPMKCNFTLSCGKHKCESNCHKGRCLPCYRTSFEEMYCECRNTVIYPPVPCGTKIECNKPCSRAHSCDHPVTHNCHSSSSCPPCMAFTTKYCHGKHEQRKIIPCSQADFSCGLPCNKPLKCGQHNCIKSCHAGPCELETDVCKQNCTKLRVMCPHKCNAPCHLKSDCPDTPCRENVEVLCQCGLRKQTRTCYDFASDYRKIATSQLASSMQQMQNGNTIELSDVLGPIKMANNKTLECTEECRVAERNRRLAIGLQIRNPDLPSKLQPKYSEFIRSWAKKDAKLVNMIHDKLTELVKLAKESRQRSRSYSFPTMNREKRQLVHEMCTMFGVESVAYDAEPNRNVVATATRETSWLPGMSILETIQRESGQRRIPVPSLNAWGLKR